MALTMVPTQVLHDSEQNILNWHKRGVGVTVVVVCRFVKECRPVQGASRSSSARKGWNGKQHKGLKYSDSPEQPIICIY